MKRKPYPAYRDSGVEWLGEVPRDWQVLPLKRMAEARLSNIDKLTVEGQQAVRLCNYVDVYKNERILAQMNFMTATASDDQIRRLSLRFGDVIITKDSETPDDIGIPALVAEDMDGVVCGYHLALLRPAEEVAEGPYLARLLQSTFVRAHFETFAVGLTRYGLGKYDIENVPLPSPPVDDQVAIAVFLDRATAKLDALIAKQEQLITLLQEKRQALISHAVTKGLIPGAPMKDSGVEWLGQVPAHWEMTPLKWLTDPTRPIMYGIVLPGPDVGEGIPILKGGNIRPNRMNLESMSCTTAEIEAPYARARLKSGDLVYSIRGSVGDCEIVPAELNGSNITQDVARVAIGEGNHGSWARWALLSSPVREALASGSLGAAVRGINIFDLKRVRLPTPSPGEQLAIATFLNDETTRLDSLIEKSRRSIDLLREHRTALISAAVTGKIDVRDAA